MRHFAAPSFWACYRTLPKSVRDLADKNYELLKSNAAHARLHFKKVLNYRAVRVGLQYRTLAIEVDDDLLFWIGSHSEYDKLIGNRALQTGS